jgi:hypothetical protein
MKKPGSLSPGSPGRPSPGRPGVFLSIIEKKRLQIDKVVLTMEL